MLSKSIETAFVVKGIAPAGLRLGDLLPFQVGLYDENAQVTVDAGTYCADKHYKFVYKTSSTGFDTSFEKDKLDAKVPIFSLPLGKIDRVHTFNQAIKTPTPFVSYLGWDSNSPCESLSFECGKTYGLLIQARGKNVRDVLGSNFLEYITFNTPCCEGCDIQTGCEKVIDEIMAQVRNQSYYLDKNFMKIEKVQSCCPPADPFGRTWFVRWQIVVPDNGTPSDLADIQLAYPNDTVTRVSRTGIHSTYEIVRQKIGTAALTIQAVTASATATVNRRVNVTPASDTEITIPAGADGNVIEIVNTGVTNFDVTYAGAISGGPIAVGNGVRLVRGASVWTVQPFPTGPSSYSQVRYSLVDCDTCPTGFTQIDPFDKYLVKTLPTDPNGIATITALGGTFADVEGANLIGMDANLGVYEVLFPVGTVLPAVEGTVVTSIGTQAGRCFLAAGTYTWSPVSEAYKITRTLCLTKAVPDCNAPADLDRMIAAYTGADIVSGSVATSITGDCIRRYTLSQYNNDLLEDGCDTFGKDGARFDAISAFDGLEWSACECEGWTFDVDGCPVAPAAAPAMDCRCGIKFTGAFLDSESLNCYFNPDHAIQVDPITIEVSLVDQNMDYCEVPFIPYKIVQLPKIVQGLGAYVFRDVIRSRGYQNYLYFNPDAEDSTLMRLRTGMDFGVDPEKFYHHISVYHNSTINRQAFQSDSKIREELRFYVDADNIILQQQLATFLNGTLLANNVCELI